MAVVGVMAIPASSASADYAPGSNVSANGSNASMASGGRGGSSSSLGTHNLRLPASIHRGIGSDSLADFAAQMTCLFWLEDDAVVMAAAMAGMAGNASRVMGLSGSTNGAGSRGSSGYGAYQDHRLTRSAIPSEAFKKWVYNILSTTQVTQNVVLLALMFIWRLRRLNPSVKGLDGSEFRLLTVALMLGNKCE